MGNTIQGRKKEIALDIYGKEIENNENLDDIIDDMLAVLPRVEEEYLVSGARLRCSQACKNVKKLTEHIFVQNKMELLCWKLKEQKKLMMFQLLT